MTVIAMSQTEIDGMSVLCDLADDRIKVADAATLIGLGRRQVFRLAKTYSQHGPEALVSRRRSRPSNRYYPSAFARRSHWHHPGAVFRLWPDTGGREAGRTRTARHLPGARDTAAIG